MTDVRSTIEIDRPVRTVYDQWTQFETFPEFMDGVQRVRQLDDKNLEWTAKIAGTERSWTASIVRQEPDRCVAWMSTSGATNGGMVTFEPIDANRTRVDLALQFEPEGFVENAGDKLGLVQRRAKADLERFKEFIEERSTATGAWRGSVEGGTVER